jgi:hypothetical protein
VDAVNSVRALKVPTEEIIYTCVAHANTKHELFACIGEDAKLQIMTCYIFRMQPNKAREACLLLGAAAQLAKRDADTANPFAPVSGISDDPIPPDLLPLICNRRLLVAVKGIGAGQFGQVYLANKLDAVGGESFTSVAVRWAFFDRKSRSRMTLGLHGFAPPREALACV